MSSATYYVNSAGVVDAAPPLTRKSIENQRARAEAAKQAAANTKPAPAETFVNDTTKPKAPPPPKGPGVISKVRGVINGPAPTPGGAPGPIARAAGYVGQKAASAGGFLARRAIPALAVGNTIADAQADDATERYAKRFNVSEPAYDGSAGDVMHASLLRAGGFASDLANNLSGGILGQTLYRDRDMPMPPPGDQMNTAAAVQQPADPRQIQPSAPPSQPATSPEPAISIGPIQSRRMLQSGIIQDGPASFTDGRSPPLPSQGISAQNQSALDNLVANQPQAPQDFESRMGISQEVYDARQRSREVASLKNSGFNRAERMEIMAGVQPETLATGETKGIIRRQQQQQLAMGDQELAAGAIKNQAAGAEASQSQNMAGMVNQLLTLNNQNDPTGEQRMQIHQNLRALGVNRAGVEETPEERYIRDLTKAAYSDAMRSPEEAQAIIENGMRMYRGGGAGAGQDVTVDPTQSEAPPMEGARRAPDGNWYVQQNGKWMKVEA